MTLSASQMRAIALGGLTAITGALLYPLAVAEASMGQTDKLVHAVMFFTATACVKAILLRTPALVTAVIAVVIGGVLELLQGLVGRDPSWGDLAADGVGAGAFALAFWAVRRIRRRQPACEPPQ